MFNLDTNAMAAQIAAKSTAEKEAFRRYVLKYNDLFHATDYHAVSVLYDEMIVDPDISVQTFVLFLLYANM